MFQFTKSNLYSYLNLRPLKYWITCHSCESRNPELYHIFVNTNWIPTSVGMTRSKLVVFQMSQFILFTFIISYVINNFGFFNIIGENE